MFVTIRRAKNLIFVGNHWQGNELDTVSNHRQGNELDTVGNHWQGNELDTDGNHRQGNKLDTVGNHWHCNKLDHVGNQWQGNKIDTVGNHWQGNKLDTVGKKVEGLLWPGASQWRIYYHRMWSQLSTTCSNLLKQSNEEPLVAVDHNQLQTIASETVEPINWSHPNPHGQYPLIAT